MDGFAIVRDAQALSSRQQSTQPPLGAQPPSHSLLVSYRPLASLPGVQ